VRFVDPGHRDDAVELVRKGLDSLRAQALELRPAVVHGLGG
jgi:aryl carrier-like protein